MLGSPPAPPLSMSIALHIHTPPPPPCVLCCPVRETLPYLVCRLSAPTRGRRPYLHTLGPGEISDSDNHRGLQRRHHAREGFAARVVDNLAFRRSQSVIVIAQRVLFQFFRRGEECKKGGWKTSTRKGHEEKNVILFEQYLWYMDSGRPGSRHRCAIEAIRRKELSRRLFDRAIDACWAVCISFAAHSHPIISPRA